MFQDFVNIWIISGPTFFLNHGLRFTEKKLNSFQFHTHAHFIPAKKDFWYIKVRRYNIFNFILLYHILSFVNKNIFQKFVYIVYLHYFRSNFFFVTMVLDMQIQFNSIIYCSILFHFILSICFKTFSIFELFQV